MFAVKIAIQITEWMSVRHEQLVKIVEDYRKVKGDQSASMLAVHAYLHGKQIEKANKVKSYLAAYRGQA